MKPTDKSSPKIRLTKTFFSIEKGDVSASDVAARKKAAKEAARQETIRQGSEPDKTDPFIGNFNK